jgi:hypothetical protein
LRQDGPRVPGSTREVSVIDHVIWLGGGCGSGKSSIARELVHRFDLVLYATDAHAWEHWRRRGAPDLGSGDDRWLRTPPEELARQFVSGSDEVLPLILEDLDALRDGPLVLAEGPQLFPHLVAPHLASSAHGLWLMPTLKFQRWALGRRGEPSGTSDRERALQNRLARDAILNELIRGQASGLGLSLLEVDGSRTLHEMIDAVADYFTEQIAAGPRARDGAEHRRIRRQENVAIHSNLCSLRAQLGLAKPPVFDFACECGTLGCRERVLLTVDEYGTALEPPERYVVLREHAGEVAAASLGESGSLVG